MIIELTPEQEALIPVYREKWKKKALLTEPIDRQKATEVVKSLYAFYHRNEPSIIFCDSPDARIKIILKIEERLGKPIGRGINKSLLAFLFYHDLDHRHLPSISMQIGDNLQPLILSLQTLADRDLINQDLDLHISESKYNSCICMQSWSHSGSIPDFGISVLNLDYNRDTWQLFQRLSSSCSLIYPYENIAIICVRVACRRLIAPTNSQLTLKVVSMQKENPQCSFAMDIASMLIMAYIYQNPMVKSPHTNGTLTGT